MSKKISPALVGVLSTLGIVVVIVAISIMSIVGHYNESVHLENRIMKLHKASENELYTFSMQVVEVSKVARAHKADAIEYIAAAMKGRYGEDGSQAAWQFLKEDNPGIDATLRIKVAQIVEGGRNNFKVSQNIKLDACNVYKNKLDVLWGGTMKSLVGFPKIDLSDICEIVSNEHARDAFKSKTEKPIEGLDS